MSENITKIVTIGGGSGQYVLLSGLRDMKYAAVTAVVSMVDSGGSTGRLRDEFGMLPPGDILKCILALSPNRDVARQILQKRFNNNSKLSGHSAGNLLLTILSQYAGSFPEGVKALGELLSIKGTVLPVTTDKATLVAELADGTHLYGEAVIDVPKEGRREKIVNTFLVPHHSESIKVYPPVIEAIESSDYIIIGPGDFYSSITPNFLVGGIKEAIAKTEAKIIYVANIMTKFGETDNFTDKDFIYKLEVFLGRQIDEAIFNSSRPEEKVLKEYEMQKAKLVECYLSNYLDNRKIIKEDLISGQGDMARHDPIKLAKVVADIIDDKKPE